MMNKILLLLTFVFIANGCLIYAQNVDPSTVDVANLTDDQINQIVIEMNKRGLSENDAVNLARAKGMTNDQIYLLRQRIKEFNASGGISKAIAKGKLTKTEEVNEETLTVLSSKTVLDESLINNKIFGFSFFNSKKLTFDPSINVPISNSYLLGVGDEIIIDVWGASEQTYQLRIASNGEVRIPLVGPVYLSGLTFKQAKSRLKSVLGSIYRDLKNVTPKTFVSIRTGQLKTIRVNVVGEVAVPGTYTLPGTATLFNVLYLCGGPDLKGSFRDIQLIRNGEIISHLDVYDFLINGNSQVNISLADNDVIMVPTYINRVRVEGEFKRDGIFEAKEGETVQDMVKYAGGFTENAYKNILKLYRNTGKQKTFKEVPIDSINLYTLQSGDSLFVGKILDRFINKVSIKGAVFNSGDYEYREGLMLSELIQRADGLIENAYLNRGLITRLKNDYTPENISFNVGKVISGESDIVLKQNDNIIISAIDDMRENQIVAVWGEVQNMGEYPYADNMTIEDLVFLAGGFKESASESTLEVRRRLPYDVADQSSEASSELYYFHVSRDLKLDEDATNFILKPFDAIAVRFMPGSLSSGSVTIAGNIMYGGIYNLTTAKERISDIVNRAGGLAANAYPEGASLYRKVNLSEEEKAKRDELMKMDSTLVFSELEFESVSVNLKDILENPGSKEDIFMRDGDVINIPSELQTVKVSGEVLNPSSTVYEKRYSVRQYINASGGFSINAKKGKTYVLRPNGASYATKGFLFFRRYPKVTPGSEIIIPQKPIREGLSAQAWIGIASALASLSLTVITITNRFQ